MATTEKVFRHLVVAALKGAKYSEAEWASLEAAAVVACGDDLNGIADSDKKKYAITCKLIELIGGGGSISQGTFSVSIDPAVVKKNEDAYKKTVGELKSDVGNTSSNDRFVFFDDA